MAEQEVKLVDIALVRSANQSSIPTDLTFVLLNHLLRNCSPCVSRRIVYEEIFEKEKSMSIKN